MLKTAFKTIPGSRHKREAKKVQPLIAEINEMYDERSDERLEAKTDGSRRVIEDPRSDLKAQLGELEEERRHSEDPIDRERLSLSIGGLEERLIDATEKALEAGENLLAVKRGAPKRRKLTKLFFDDPSLQTLVNKVEADFMREKRFHEVEEMLYFAMEEKGHNVRLSDRGLDEMSPNDPEAFTVPDLPVEMGETEKRERLEVLEAEYAAKSRKIHVIHQLLNASTLLQKDEKSIIGEDGQVEQCHGRAW